MRVTLLSLSGVLSLALFAFGCDSEDARQSREWSAAEQVDPGHLFNSGFLRMKAGPGARTLAVWQRGEIDRWRVVASWHEPGQGWGPVSTLDRAEGSAISPDVTVDSEGRALVVWAQGTEERNSVWSSRYLPADGWGAAELVDEDDAGFSYDPKVENDAEGNGLAVWSHSIEAQVHVVSSIFAEQDGWGRTERVNGTAAEDAWFPNLGIDDSDNGVALWEQGTPPHTLWASRYVKGAGWGVPSQIPSGEIGGFHAFAVCPDGTGWAVWPVRESSDAGATEIHASAYTVGGWESTELVQSAASTHADLPAVAIASDGAPFAAWGQWGTDRWEVWASRYAADDGWTQGQRVAAAGSVPSQAGIATGLDGSVVVTWYSFYKSEEDEPHTAWASALRPDGSWGEAQLLGRGPVTQSAPSAVLHPDGTRLVVWEEWDGDQNTLWSRESR